MTQNTRISLFVYVLFIVVSTVLACFSFDGYSILSNTTSHLGAQGSPYSWVMNGVFILLGVLSIWHTYRSRIRYHQIVGGVFGISLIMAGLFQHAPLVESVQADRLQDLMHSIFANITGFSFTMLAIGHGIISRGFQRSTAILLAMVAIAISITMFAFPEIMGLLQRAMFISAFGWLFFYMKPSKDKQASNRDYSH